ncbi:MAG TPA: HAD family hydrolase [Streptosporangiaceae bacterium]|jgi:HAD superfamily hydrolase (TIGR01509 family)|nr:HAD family hydrolase [Streptosporangiaceae bacterium]
MTDDIAAVLFDVDGTLVDTNYLHAVTWWQAFCQGGHADVPMTRIHRAIGMGSDRLLDELLPADRDRDADQEMLTAHLTLYATYWSRLRAFRGAADLLRACKDRGLRVVLATSASKRELGVMRKAMDADAAIDEATDADDVEASKPAADLVQAALDRAGVSAGQAIFVGDTIWDVEACKKAGVRCIALLSGGISRGELEDAGAVEIYDGPADLLSALPRLLRADRDA